MTTDVLQKVIDKYLAGLYPSSVDEYDYTICENLNDNDDIFAILKSCKISKDDFVKVNAKKDLIKKSIINSPSFYKFIEKYKKIILPNLIYSINEKLSDDLINVDQHIYEQKSKIEAEEERRKNDALKKSAIRKISKVNLTADEKKVLGI